MKINTNAVHFYTLTMQTDGMFELNKVPSATSQWKYSQLTTQNSTVMFRSVHVAHFVVGSVTVTAEE